MLIREVLVIQFLAAALLAIGVGLRAPVIPLVGIPLIVAIGVAFRATPRWRCTIYGGILGGSLGSGVAGVVLGPKLNVGDIVAAGWMVGAATMLLVATNFPLLEARLFPCARRLFTLWNSYWLFNPVLPNHDHDSFRD